MKYLNTILLLLIISTTTSANEYTYRDGFYWNGSKAYSRQLYQYPGYWSYGVYYPGAYYYQYTEVPVATEYKTKTVTYNDPGWRSKLLDIAAQRDKFEGEIRKNAHEQAYFMDAVKGLGLTGNFRWNGYGEVPPSVAGGYSYGGQGYISTYGANASTKYGYSYNSLSQLYGDGDLNQLYQAASQLAHNAQKLGGEATGQFSALAGQEGANRARVAEILAKGQMAQQILQALETAPSGVTKGFSFKFNEKGVFEKTEAGVPPKVKGELSDQFATVAKNRCASCHNSIDKKGGFDVYDYPTLSTEDKQKVWLRLVTENETLMMPKAVDGGPGKRLTPDEFRAFLLVPSAVPSMKPIGDK